MKMKGLAVVLLLAQTTATLAASREYRFVSQLKTWTESQSYCRERFAELATIETEEDWAEVANMMRNSESDFVWIGLYEGVKSWRWSLDNTSLYNAVYSFLPFSFDYLNRKEYCAVLGGNGVADLDCAERKPSLCYDEPSNTYIPVTDLMTWQSARNHCRQEHTDLAILRNQKELQTAQSMIDPNLGKWWIGLSRESWKWSDQTNFLFRNWAVGQPNQINNQCVGANVAGYNDLHCTWIYPFICSVPIRKVLKVEVETNGNVDLNDPLIQAAILSQAEKDMRARGIKQDFKLTWRNQPTGNVFN